jgi:hypothetical protein
MSSMSVPFTDCARTVNEPAVGWLKLPVKPSSSSVRSVGFLNPPVRVQAHVAPPVLLLGFVGAVPVVVPGRARPGELGPELVNAVTEGHADCGVRTPPGR